MNFKVSSRSTTGMENFITVSHSSVVSGVTWNTDWNRKIRSVHIPGIRALLRFKLTCRIIHHCIFDVSKRALTERTSTYRMTKWSVKERAMEAMSHRLDQGGMAMSDWFSDKLCRKYRFVYNSQFEHIHGTRRERFPHLFMAFNISMVTSTERAIVMGWGSAKILQLTPLNSSPPPIHAKWWVCEFRANNWQRLY